MPLFFGPSFVLVLDPVVVCALAQTHCWKIICTLHIHTHTLPLRTICSLFQATWDMEMPIQYLHKINVNEITFKKYQLSAFDTCCLLLLLGLWWMGPLNHVRRVWHFRSYLRNFTANLIWMLGIVCIFVAFFMVE